MEYQLNLTQAAFGKGVLRGFFMLFRGNMRGKQTGHPPCISGNMTALSIR